MLAALAETPVMPERRPRDEWKISPANEEPRERRRGTELAVIRSIGVHNRRYEFRGVFLVDVLDTVEGDCQVTSPRLCISGIGRDFADAIADFAEAFDCQYQGLVALREPEQLTSRAQRVREALIDAVDVTPQ